jgi:hypothetical protein
MDKVYFKEEQKFDQVWFRLIILMSWVPLIVIFGIGIYQQLILGKPWGNNPTSDTGLLLTTAFIFLIMTGVTWLTYSMKLITEITEEGLGYRFPPLINKGKRISKNTILEYQIRKYNPIGEYGGWGIKGGIGLGRGRAYNVKGNIGLQLRLQDNKKILFGTQRPEASKAAMDKMMNPEFN